MKSAEPRSAIACRVIADQRRSELLDVLDEVRANVNNDTAWLRLRSAHRRYLQARVWLRHAERER